MIDYNFGEILLLKFPYTEGVGEAKRPVVVLAQTDVKDIVVAKVTSAEPRGRYDVVIDDWQKAGLLFPSVVRVDKLATLAKSRVVKRLGILDAPCHALVKTKIRQLFNIE